MSQDANRPLVIGSQLVGVLVVILTLLTRQAELRSTRPVGDKTQVAAHPDKNGDYFARLWDDPLTLLPTFKLAEPDRPEPAAMTIAPSGTKEADAEKTQPLSTTESASSPAGKVAGASTGSVPPALQDQKAHSTTAPAETENGASPRATPAAKTGIFIWNIVDARPIPEIKEHRLRIRYAVVSALVAKGYLPTNDSVLIPLGSPPVGYYETFQLTTPASANGKTYQTVTLIWVPKQSSEQAAFNPQQRTDLQKKIAEQSHVLGDGPAQLLHHGSSDDFRVYLDRQKKADTNISFVRATIPARDLQNQDPQHVESIRPITADDTLVQALVGELCLRIPALNRPEKQSGRPRIIICTESDTNYGRAIAARVSQELHGVANVETYTYLRGLDGRPEDIPNRSKPDQTKPSDIATSLLRGKAISEASIGTSQFDYLRRLSLHLEQQKKQKGSQICAVGVLGTDIYDKMLVLQALRPQLGAAVFFTTDLDALYLEQPNESFTRNLIVASADSLEGITQVSDAGNWNLPPMRDSYQTVLVRHVWKILDSAKDTPGSDPASSNPGSGERVPPIKRAHVFEIVAGKSINLTPVFPSNFSGKPWLSWLALWGNIFIFLFGLANAFAILWAISTRKVNADDPEAAPMNKGAQRFVYAEIGIVLLFLVFLLLLFASSAESFLGEPLSLEASVWPSITMRLLAIIVAIRLLMIASKAFVVRRPEIEKTLTENMPSNLELPLAEGILQEMVTNCKSLLAEEVQRPQKKTLEQVFIKHFDKDARRKRIMWASLGYLAFSFLLFFYWPPAVPARGAYTFLVEKVVLALGVGLYIIHLMYCLDLHISASTMLRTLRSFYSPAIQKAVGDRRFDTNLVLSATGELTAIIGKTLLYPLTILILIIISRLRIFDNWTMTPSLSATFLVGAAVLILASLVLWHEGALLKAAVMRHKIQPAPANESEKIEQLNDGAFAPWHRQPILAALFSTVAVFGSLTVAEPLVRLFVGSP